MERDIQGIRPDDQVVVGGVLGEPAKARGSKFADRIAERRHYQTVLLVVSLFMVGLQGYRIAVTPVQR